MVYIVTTILVAVFATLAFFDLRRVRRLRRELRESGTCGMVK